MLPHRKLGAGHSCQQSLSTFRLCSTNAQTLRRTHIGCVAWVEPFCSTAKQRNFELVASPARQLDGNSRVLCKASFMLQLSTHFGQHFAPRSFPDFAAEFGAACLRTCPEQKAKQLDFQRMCACVHRPQSPKRPCEGEIHSKVASRTEGVEQTALKLTGRQKTS